jgi:hypothetical protein
MYKLIFKVIDDDTKEDVFPYQQTLLELSDDILHKADEKDADMIKKEVELLGGKEMYATYAYNGRGKVVKDICQAAGIIVGKFLEKKLAPRLGCKHIAMIDIEEPDLG